MALTTRAGMFGGGLVAAPAASASANEAPSITSAPGVLEMPNTKPPSHFSAGLTLPMRSIENARTASVFTGIGCGGSVKPSHPARTWRGTPPRSPLFW